MAEKVPAGQVSLGDLATLAATVGGTRGKQVTTTSPGDTTALQQVLANLQGADYNAMLQSIFQQAGVQIPGLQAATGRAVGARSYNNTAAQAAMQELLKATTLAAQEKIVAQQLQNQQVQAQAGQAIAQATKGTTQATTEKKGLDLGRTVALLALMQGLGKVQGMDFGKIFASSGGGAAGGGVSNPVATSASTAPMAAPVNAAAASAPTSAATSQPMSSGMGPAQALVTALTNPVQGILNLFNPQPASASSITVDRSPQPLTIPNLGQELAPVDMSQQLGLIEPYMMGAQGSPMINFNSPGLTYNPEVWEL